MTITWLGQAGYVITTKGGTKIMIDPYLSDNLFNTKGKNFTRCVPIDEKWLSTKIDVLALTHMHDDHTDPETLKHVLSRGEKVVVLAPVNNWDNLRHTYNPVHNYLMFDAGIEVCVGDAVLKAVPAAHSDLSSIGIVVDDGEKCVYHTGDTMYRKDIPTHLEKTPDAMIFPINGVGNNMNSKDARRFADLVGAQKLFPMHWDMFAAYGCDVNDFISICKDRPYDIIVPPHYKEVEI